MYLSNAVIPSSSFDNNTTWASIIWCIISSWNHLMELQYYYIQLIAHYSFYQGWGIFCEYILLSWIFVKANMISFIQLLYTGDIENHLPTKNGNKKITKLIFQLMWQFKEIFSHPFLSATDPFTLYFSYMTSIEKSYYLVL